MATKRRIKTYRTQFRKMRNGSVFYQASDSTGPFVKVGNGHQLPANVLPFGASATLTAVADRSAVAIKVGKFILKSQSAV